MEGAHPCAVAIRMMLDDDGFLPLAKLTTKPRRAMTNPTDALTAVPDAEWQQKYRLLLGNWCCATIDAHQHCVCAHTEFCEWCQEVNTTRAALDAFVLTRQPAVAPKAHESLVAELHLDDPLGPAYQVQLAADILAGEVPAESFDVRALAAHLGGLAYQLKAAALRTPAQPDALDFLAREGYRRCDIMACNCGSWHGGHLRARLDEIKEAVEPENGETILAAVQRRLRTPAQSPTCVENAENYTRPADMLSEHTRSAPAQSPEVERERLAWTLAREAMDLTHSAGDKTRRRVAERFHEILESLSVLPAESAAGAAREESGT